MRTFFGLCALSVVITASAAAQPYTTCEDVVVAQDEALEAAERTIAELRGALNAAKERASLEAARADLAERQIGLMSASYERELRVLNSQIRVGKWRRIVDILTAGGVGFAVGELSQ